MVLPHDLVTGDAITFVREQMDMPGGLAKKYTFSGSVYFDRMKERDNYTTDIERIRKRVQAAGMTNVFAGTPARISV